MLFALAVRWIDIHVADWLRLFLCYFLRIRRRASGSFFKNEVDGIDINQMRDDFSLAGVIDAHLEVLPLELMRCGQHYDFLSFQFAHTREINT